MNEEPTVGGRCGRVSAGAAWWFEAGGRAGGRGRWRGPAAALRAWTALTAAGCVLCTGCAQVGGSRMRGKDGIVAGHPVPSGPAAAVVRGGRAVHLPGTSVTYYASPAAAAQLSSYLGTASIADYVRQPDGAYAPLPSGQGTASPGGRWFAAVAIARGRTGEPAAWWRGLA